MTRRSRSPIDPARRLAAAGALDSYERDLRDAITRAGDGGLVDVAWTTTSSPVGELVLAITERGLVAISFGMRDELLEELAEVVSPRVVRRAQALDEVRRELDEYFAGTRREFDLRLDLALSRGFRRTVLEHLAQLPYGHTTTYAELAAESGSPSPLHLSTVCSQRAISMKGTLSTDWKESVLLSLSFSVMRPSP